MFAFSQSAGYAVLALSCLDGPEGRLVLEREIARRMRIPKPYLAKLLGILARQGMVRAKRGYRGGVYLTRPPEEITVLEVAEAIEGKGRLWGCLLGLRECRCAELCPAHTFWVRECRRIESYLRRITLADMAKVTPEYVARARASGAIRRTRPRPLLAKAGAGP